MWYKEVLGKPGKLRDLDGIVMLLFVLPWIYH
jgi:hypothetical protein